MTIFKVFLKQMIKQTINDRAAGRTGIIQPEGSTHKPLGAEKLIKRSTPVRKAAKGNNKTNHPPKFP